MLVPAPYAHAYMDMVRKESAEKISVLYLVFTRGKKAVVRGFESISPYAEYAEEEIGKNKELLKRGYAYSLRSIMERGEDGLYHVKIAKERVIPVLSPVRNYTENIPTILPVLAQGKWLNYLEEFKKSAVTDFDEAIGSIGVCSEKNYKDIFTDIPTILPILSQDQWLMYLRGLTASPATKFDRALDARYLQDYLGGYNHRMFDGSHTLGGAWSKIDDMCSRTGCSTREQVNGFFKALWKDSTTPKGLPFVNMEKQTYDSLAGKLERYGISKKWTYDALSYDALEVLAAGISAVAVVYFLKEGQIEELSETLGAMGVVSVVSANPLLALVMISSVGYAIATGTDLDTVAATEGVVKSSIISGALVLLPGAFLLQITAAIAISILLEESMKDENYSFVMDYAMEKVQELEQAMEKIEELVIWTPDIQKDLEGKRAVLLARFPEVA